MSRETRRNTIEELAARYCASGLEDDRIRIWRAMVRRFGPTTTKDAIDSMKETYKLLTGNT